MDFDVRHFLYEEVRLEDPKVRRRNLFEKLTRLANKHGLPVIAIIAECWDEACNQCKRSTPPRMFCRLVKLRLIEAQLWHEDRKFQGMSLDDILNSGVFRQRAKMPLFEGEAKPLPRPGHHSACQSPSCKGCG